MTLQEWIDFYNEKNPQDPFEPTKGYTLQFREDKGFCEVAFHEDMVLIGNLAGDGRFFKKQVEEAAKKLGIRKGGTICTRPNALAYIRLFGYRVVGTEDAGEGRKRYRVRDAEGRAGLVSPAWTYDETGKDAYFVTWDF